MAKVAIDHITVAATTLAQGSDYVEAQLGARPRPGGKHVAMGTHNALLRLDARTYLEVIAIDPEGVAPSHPRWFDLDEPRMRAALAEGPRLIHFVVRTDDIALTLEQSGAPLGKIHAIARGDLSWQITIPDDGHLPGRGLIPTLIQWPADRHPAEGLPDSNLRLAALAGEHPDPASIRAVLANLGLSEQVKITYAQSPRLAAMIRTPRGLVTM